MIKSKLVKFTKRVIKRFLIQVNKIPPVNRATEVIIGSYLKSVYQIHDVNAVTYLFINHLVGDTFLYLQLLGPFAEKYGTYPVPVLRSNCANLIKYFPQIKNYFVLDEKRKVEKLLFGVVSTIPSLYDVYKKGSKIWITKGVHPTRVRSIPPNHFIAFAMSLGVEDIVSKKFLPSVDDHQMRLAEVYFEKHSLLYNKTVILAPFSNSQSIISRGKENIELFTMIANLLKKKGYCVCTNVDQKNPNPIEGTIPVHPSLDIIIPFCTFAGNLIAFRSGFCDIAAYSKARMFILFPNDRCPFDATSYINYFSIEYMHDRQAWEKVVDFKSVKYLAEEITEFFQ